jgi:periplasmic protein TonB
MKPVSKKKVKWDDVIFAKRNKHYGAYLIRKTYSRYIFSSVFIALIITAILIASPLLSKLIPREDETQVVEMVTVKYTELAPPPPIEKNVPPPPKVLIAQPIRNVIKYVEPKVTKHEVVEKEDVPTVEEIKQNQTGPENIKGTNEVYEAEEVVVDDRKDDENKVYEAVEHNPQYEGGIDALRKFLSRNLRYPERAKPKSIEGVVYITFVVGSDGTISQVETLKPLDPDCDKEAIRVIKKMPPWKAGMQNGKTVRVRFTLPITFRYIAVDS